MFDSDRNLRHIAFFEEIASTEEGDSANRAATAGLVVLRLVDAWLEDGPSVSSDDGFSVHSVASAIEDVSDGTPIRSLLARVIESLQSRKPDIHVVITPLMAYAQALEYDAKWRLAADVYRSVLAHLHPIEDSDASIAAHLRLGSCCRYLNQIDEATEAFAAASEIASVAGDIVGVLRAHIGEAHVSVIRGNLPRAEHLLDETIARATGPDLRDVRSRALHERSNVAHLRKNYELAIRLAYDALPLAHAPTERDRILGDIASAFIELGVYTAARDAYMVLSATAQEQYTRWAATLNLVEISALTGAEMLFELYRRQLARQQLPPYMATAFELSLGIGYQRFGNTAKARVHLERALVMATEHGFNQYLFEAEEGLLQLETQMPPRRVSTEISLDIEEVAGAIREMREAMSAS